MLTMIRATVKPEFAQAVEDAVSALFAAIREARPAGLRYTSTRLADGVTFVALVELADGTPNPLPGVPAFVEFQDRLATWLAEPASREQLTVIASYRSF